MVAWGSWRDKDAAEHYWLATDMGKDGSTPAVVPEIERRLLEQGKIGTLLAEDFQRKRLNRKPVYAAGAPGGDHRR
jgi:hypothetical protein